MSKQKRVKVCVMIDGRPLTYRGKLISKNDKFISIDDQKEGIIEFNLSNVVYIKEELG